MDINSRIDFKPGMELSSRTLNEMARSSEKHNVAFIRSLFARSIGLLPSAEQPAVEGMFVRKSLEFDVRNFLGVLRCGKILDLDEKGSIEISNLDDGVYYLAAGFSERREEFECNCVPMTRPVYDFSLCTLQQLEEGDVLPLMRLSVSAGTVSIDQDYMLPCLQIGTEKKYSEYLGRIIPLLDALWKHPNLAEGAGKTALMWLSAKMACVNGKSRTADFHSLCKDLTQAVDFYVFRPNTESPEPVAAFSEYDPQLFLSWMVGYLERAAALLDTVVLKDDTIDVEALRKELYDSLGESLRALLAQQLEERTAAMRQDMMDSLGSSLKNFVETDLRSALHDSLGQQLTEELSKTLYPSLYESLYDALFVPQEKVEEEYTPIM